MWTILKTYKNTLGGSRRTVVDVKCDCGSIETRRLDHVLSGRTKSCKSCASKLTAQKFGIPNNSKAIGELSGTYFLHLKYGAKKRGLDFDVSMEYLWELFLLQNGRCALTGQEIQLSRKIKKQNVDYGSFNASLDRIDSSIGYIKGNLQWVHRDINRFKNNYNQNQFIEMCKLVAEFN